MIQIEDNDLPITVAEKIYLSSFSSSTRNQTRKI